MQFIQYVQSPGVDSQNCRTIIKETNKINSKNENKSIDRNNLGVSFCLVWFGFLDTGSCCVAQASLEVLGSNENRMGTTDTCYHIQLFLQNFSSELYVFFLYFQNMSDAMAILHKLQTGLDVNVRFTGVRVFEYTPECIVFDLLDIPLYHGWLVDPQVSRI